MKKDELIRLSKTISYALRHDPESFGLSLEDDGSVKLEDLIKVISENKKKEITKDDILSAISLPGKKRFVIENERIRAYYGHSIKKEIVKPLIEPPEILYHATSHKALPIIMKDGLKPMGRQHVHLSSEKETALEAGRRKDNNPPLLVIRAKDVYKDGIKFYKGNEDIFLSDSIEPKYISISN